MGSNWFCFPFFNGVDNIFGYVIDSLFKLLICEGLELLAYGVFLAVAYAALSFMR